MSLENTVQRRWSSELLQSTRGLTEECSRFKNVLFRGVMGNGQYGDRDTDRLLTAFNRYLKSWEDYGEQIVNGLNEASDDHKDISSNVDYNDIREFVYASYDYASVLQYADGVFKGIGDDKFKKADDVRDFFDHTIGKAFDDLPDTVGGVLDVFLQCEGPEWNIIDTMGTSNFKTLRSNRRKLFNPRTRTELYRAIDKTLKYLTNHVEDLKTNSSYDGTRTLISAINTIVDYAQISVTIYASRIYVIGTYAHPYMMYKGKREDRNTGTTAPMTEAAMNYYDDARYHVFRDADDGALRDPNNCEQLCKLFEKFLKEIGVPDLGNSRRRCTCSFSAPYIGDNALQQNVFCQKMLDDPIFNNVSSCRARYWRSGIGYNEASVNELNMVLKGSVYNRMQGLGDTSSDKNNILHIIRGTEPKTENVKGYMDLAEDLNTTALVLLIGIREVLNEFAGIASGELNNPTGLGLPQVNAAAEVMRMLSFLYREIAFAVIQKARYIEIKLNEMVDEDATRIASELSIKIPGKTDDSVKLNDAMMMSVPDTSRMPMELIDLYMLPTFEALEMYDDALRMDPMFESDIYLSEAVNISSIINAIIALIQGSLRRFQSFWNNDGVKSAVKWVTDHEQEILKIDTTGKSMKVLPFKVNASGAESIDITPVSDNLISKLNQFPANGKLTNESAQAYIKSLYPSEAVYKFFTDQNDKDGKLGAARYRNYILYAKDEASVTDQEPAMITLQGPELQKKLTEWVATVKSGQAAYNGYLRISADLEKAINNMKAKVVAASNKQPAQQQTQSGSTSGQQPPEVKDNAGTTEPPAPTAQGQSQQKNEAEGQEQILNTMLSDTQRAVSHLWDSATVMFVNYIRTEYKYIKEAYTMVSAPTAAPAPQQQTNNQ